MQFPLMLINNVPRRHDHNGIQRRAVKVAVKVTRLTRNGKGTDDWEWNGKAGCTDCVQERSRHDNASAFGQQWSGLQINDSAAVYQATINGSGVALGRTTLVALDLAAGRLVRPFGDAMDCELAYYLVHRPRADGDPGIAAFKNWICTEAQADGAYVG
jgi:DNA-binding transcriptional LysR family regulator